MDRPVPPFLFCNDIQKKHGNSREVNSDLLAPRSTLPIDQPACPHFWNSHLPECLPLGAVNRIHLDLPDQQVSWEIHT